MANTYVGIDRQFIPKAELDSLWAAFNKKIPLWQSGLEAPTEIEKFAFFMLRDKFKENFHV